MAFSPLARFPFNIVPMNNISAPTYRDGTTYTLALEELKVWLNDVLAPHVNDALADVTAQYQNGIENAEQTVTEARTAWDTSFATFMAGLDNEIQAMNDAGVAALVDNAASTTGAALRTLIDAETTAEQIMAAIGATVYTRTQADDLFATKTGVAADIATVDGRVTNLDGELTALGTEVDAEWATARAAHHATSAELVVTPDRVTGPVGARLNLPSHAAGNANGEATHPSVAYRPEGWNGYAYWMAYTPYQGADDSMEDPNVAASKDGVTWTVPAGLTNPLDDAPGSPGAYNSDTDAVFGPDNKLYVFWRNYDPNATGAQEKLYYRSSSDGVTWGPKTLVYSADQGVRRLISPSYVFEDGAWTCWFLDMVPAPFRIMRMRSTGPDPVASSWSAPVGIGYSNGSQAAAFMANRAPWHLNVIKAYGRYHMLVNDYSTDNANPARDLIYMNSPDGVLWQSAIGPCIPRLQTGQHDMMYRATMIPAIRRGVYGFRVWYGAFNTAAIPNTWSVYRTFISDGPRTEKGSFTADVAAATDAATPAYKAQQITFSRFFKYPPEVVVSASTGFIGTAAHPISTTGFQFNIDNPVQSARNGVTFHWSATEPE